MKFLELIDFEWEPERVDELANICSLIIENSLDDLQNHWSPEIEMVIKSAGKLLREGKLNEPQFDNLINCLSEISDIPSYLLFISWIIEEINTSHKIRRSRITGNNFFGEE